MACELCGSSTSTSDRARFAELLEASVASGEDLRIESVAEQAARHPDAQPANVTGQRRGVVLHQCRGRRRVARIVAGDDRQAGGGVRDGRRQRADLIQ